MFSELSGSLYLYLVSSSRFSEWHVGGVLLDGFGNQTEQEQENKLLDTFISFWHQIDVIKIKEIRVLCA